MLIIHPGLKLVCKIDLCYSSSTSGVGSSDWSPGKVLSLVQVSCWSFLSSSSNNLLLSSPLTSRTDEPITRLVYTHTGSMVLSLTHPTARIKQNKNLLSKPHLQHNTTLTQPQLNRSWVWHENGFATTIRTSTFILF